MARRIELNITKEQAAQFIDWLANDTYGGHTYTRYDITERGCEEVEFVINGHTLANYSDSYNHVIIDHVYCMAHRTFGVTVVNGVTMSNIDYCLSRLGFNIA